MYSNPLELNFTSSSETADPLTAKDPATYLRTVSKLSFTVTPLRVALLLSGVTVIVQVISFVPLLYVAFFATSAEVASVIWS